LSPRSFSSLVLEVSLSFSWTSISSRLISKSWASYCWNPRNLAFLWQTALNSCEGLYAHETLLISTRKFLKFWLIELGWLPKGNLSSLGIT
jgi:hypothetical protein